MSRKIKLEIEIRISKDKCDECEDKPKILEGWYNNKCYYSMCLHEKSDLDNTIEDITATVEDMIEHEKAQDT